MANEKLHGVFLKQVSSLWRYLAVSAGDRGDFDEAINLLTRDLERRSRSTWSGALLAEYLVFKGRFDEAWRAYRDYFLAAPPFDAFTLTQNRDVNGSPVKLDITERMGGIAGLPESPEIVRQIREWNAGASIVSGRRLDTLGSLTETLSDEWFNKLDDFAKLRVLLYYRYTRYLDDIAEYRAGTGKFPDSEYTVRKQEEFTTSLRTSKEAEAIWTRATGDHHLEFPL